MGQKTTRDIFRPFLRLELYAHVSIVPLVLTFGPRLAQTQGANIRCYSDYLLERVRGYRDTKTDYVRVGAGNLKQLSVDKGLLRETEAVQNQIGALVKCDVREGAQLPSRPTDSA